MPMQYQPLHPMSKNDCLPLTNFSNPVQDSKNHHQKAEDGYSVRSENQPQKYAPYAQNSPETLATGPIPPKLAGNCLDMRPKPKTSTNPGRTVGGKRKCVTRFSASSARTLSKLLASLKFRGCMFLTLTQRPGFTPRGAKNALLNNRGSFARAFVDAFPGGSIIWRLEKQKNGSPHFHLLLFLPDMPPERFLEAIWAWNPQERWKQAIAADYDPQVKDSGWVRKSRGAYLYLVGHSSKKSQTWTDGTSPGRYWGVVNKKRLPLTNFEDAELRPGEESILAALWHRHEDRRCIWLKKRYGGEPEPRNWYDSGPTKLFPFNISSCLRAIRWLNIKPCGAV